MSTNCIVCVKNKRTGGDLLCDECRIKEFRELRRCKQRLHWLHDCSNGSTDAEGFEWGIYRVKWENGKAVEVQATFSDFHDLDAEMERESTIQSTADPSDRLWPDVYGGCPECGGLGTVNENPNVECPICEGSGIQAKADLSEFTNEQIRTYEEMAKQPNPGWAATPHGAEKLTTAEQSLAALQARVDEAMGLLSHIVAEGRGREFFPRNLDGSTNEMFIRAINFTAPPTKEDGV